MLPKLLHKTNLPHLREKKKKTYKSFKQTCSFTITTRLPWSHLDIKNQNNPGTFD